MTTNQEGRQAAIRDSTSTAYGVAADWHALFDDAGISAGTFNERLLAWINAELSASYSNLVSAMQAYAEDAGYDGWEDMATLVLAMNGAETLLDGETQGLAFDFTDQSALIIDTGTPSNSTRSTGIVNQGSLAGPSGKLTYTSPSNKLTMQSDGVMRYQAHNLCLQSEDFTTTWDTQNVSGSGGGTVTANTVANPYDGSVSADTFVMTNATGQFVRQSFSGVAGATYRIAVWCRAAASGGASAIRITTNNTFSWNTGISQSFALTTEWQLLELTGVAIASGSTIRMMIGGANVDGTADAAISGTVYLWGAHVYRYPANTDYIRTTSAAKYALPLEYSATDGSCLGLPVEEQRTNLMTYSTQLDNAAWDTFSGGAPVSTNNTAPDGTATACRFDWSGVGNDYRYHGTVGTSAATTYTLSFFYKRATSTDCVFLSRDSSAAGYVATLHTATSEWQRYSQTFTATSGADFGFDFRPAVNGGISATGEILLWGVQIELGSFPTSPIITYGAAATRAADNISISSTAFPWNGDAGSFVTKYKPIGLPAAGQFVFCADGAADYDLLAPSGLGELNARVNGTAANIVLDASYTDLDEHTVALANDATSFYGSLDGAAVVTDASSLVASSSVTFYIGSRNAAAVFNGAIKYIAFVPRKLSESETITKATP